MQLHATSTLRFSPLLVIKDCGRSDESAKVTTSQEGDYFGENALLRDEPRTATIQASLGSRRCAGVYIYIYVYIFIYTYVYIVYVYIYIHVHVCVWYGMVRYGMVWYGMVWYGRAWHGMAWYGMAVSGLYLNNYMSAMHLQCFAATSVAYLL